jgi:hypothetical protein
MAEREIDRRRFRQLCSKFRAKLTQIWQLTRAAHANFGKCRPRV